MQVESGTILREYLKAFIKKLIEEGYSPIYEIPETLINEFVKESYTDWEWEKKSQRFGNMDLFYSVINEFSDPTEIYLVRKSDNKITGRLVDAKFE